METCKECMHKEHDIETLKQHLERALEDNERLKKRDRERNTLDFQIDIEDCDRLDHISRNNDSTIKTDLVIITLAVSCVISFVIGSIL